jgi:rod shape determining protein RodA
VNPAWRRFRSRFDWVLLLAILLVAAIGLVNLYSATRHAPQRDLFTQQLWWMVLGLGVYLVTTLIDYHTWQRLAWVLLLVGVVAIIGVHFAGIAVKGSRRWLGYGGFRLQPSEFMKIGVILAFARFVHDRGPHGDQPLLSTAARAMAFAAVIVLIAWQPDLGTATLVTLIVVSAAFLSSRRLWPMVAGILALGASVPFLWNWVFHDYQKKRILTFMDPASDPSGAGWHARQSIFAVGSGRVTGKSYMHGTQNQLNFLPEHWTDFPFSVWAEEWGFIGSVTLIGLYIALIMWILNVASQARDRFGSILCIGVAAMIFWHVFVNIAMVTGLAPVVGVTLPLVSYGGSSVLTTFIGLGLVSSVSMRRYAR